MLVVRAIPIICSRRFRRASLSQRTTCAWCAAATRLIVHGRLSTASSSSGSRLWPEKINRWEATEDCGHEHDLEILSDANARVDDLTAAAGRQRHNRV